MNDSKRTDEARRRLLLGVTVSGTAISLWQWKKPVVESVMLPAHAQTTVEEPGEEPRVSAVGFDSGSTVEIQLIFPDANG